MAGFVDVQVEEHEMLPEGCCLRFRATGPARPVRLVTYEAESGASGTFRVDGATSGGDVVPATAFPVDDSSAGTSILVVGGDYGLRLTSEATGEVVAEPYLLLAPGAVRG